EAADLHSAADADAVFHRRDEDLAVGKHDRPRDDPRPSLELHVVAALAFERKMHAERVKQAARPGARGDHDVVEALLPRVESQPPATSGQRFDRAHLAPLERTAIGYECPHDRGYVAERI